MTEELEVLRVVVVCPHHGETLTAWRAYTHDAATVTRVEAQLGRPVVPWVETEHAETESAAEVIPPAEWSPLLVRTTMDANGVREELVRAGDSRLTRGRDEATVQHLQVRLRCPRPSCPLDVSFTGDTRLKLRTEVVAGLWRAGHRGELRFTPGDLRL